ncbi:hypothetical protein CBM2609_A100378 [Cupriavidus taiwanensis]|uniref:Uncharacterized protein n=1 Tax=Cupriavidus taiwanensis TaxID=164546 RepID=A0A375DZZ2_9BURK|nr:hypothetical protein CBM2604_A80376 [Cupriavidus taiwanensis]SOZ22673.1 hypothetical protein CBM2609_A100378 [Cupriavidus taiwanensis]SOZ42272.1 hypothetical protein CBM2610_A100375 [Cupriavidus taiwanensis]SOZ52701.1 hypothetical protein CBM2615_A240305 [Cupriavidus taiwanensis]SOZ54213.1 hypothetical protein CBM2614_A210307 [Cupriavidus taiwanensis]
MRFLQLAGGMCVGGGRACPEVCKTLETVIVFVLELHV